MFLPTWSLGVGSTWAKFLVPNRRSETRLVLRGHDAPKMEQRRKQAERLEDVYRAEGVVLGRLKRLLDEIKEAAFG